MLAAAEQAVVEPSPASVGCEHEDVDELAELELRSASSVDGNDVPLSQALVKLLEDAPSFHVCVKPSSYLWTLLQAVDTTADALHITTYVGNRALIALCNVVRTVLKNVAELGMSRAYLYAAEAYPSNVSGNTTVQAMCSLLAGHPTLATWDLSFNDIGVAALQEIIILAKRTPSLTAVNLEGSHVRPEDRWQLDAVLLMNKKRQERAAEAASNGGASSSRQKVLVRNLTLPSSHQLDKPKATSPRRLAASVAAMGAASFIAGQASSVSAVHIEGSPSSSMRKKAIRISIPYQRKKHDPYCLSEACMRYLRDRALWNNDQAESRWPTFLANIQQTAPRDGKQAPMMRALSEPQWLVGSSKSARERASLFALVSQTNVIRAVRRYLFPDPPPPPPDAVAGLGVNNTIGPSIAQGDYDAILLRQRAQGDLLINAVVDTMSATKFLPNEMLWEHGDVARHVYLVDPASPGAIRHGSKTLVTLARSPEVLPLPGPSLDATLSRSTVSRQTLDASRQLGMSASTVDERHAVFVTTETTLMPPGQFCGYEEALCPDITTPPTRVRRATCYLATTNSASESGDNAQNNSPLAEELKEAMTRRTSSIRASRGVDVWCLRREAFEMFLSEPLAAQRALNRRLVDAMPALLGFDPDGRLYLCDALIHPTTVYAKDLPGGGALPSSQVVPAVHIAKLKDCIVVVEEGCIAVRRKSEEMSLVGRGEIIALDPSAPLQEELSCVFKAGNMPSWKYHVLPIAHLRASLPVEMAHALITRSQKTFEAPDLKLDSMGWGKRRQK